MELITTQNEITVQPQNITIDLMKQFEAFIDASPKTVKTYARAIRQFYKYIKEAGIARPTRETVLAYRDELKATRTPNTVQTYIVALRLFFQWTEAERLYPNIAEHIKGAKIDRNHKKGYLTSTQVQHVLKTAKNDDMTSVKGLRNYALLALLFTGGLRTIEASRADIEDIQTVGNDTVLFIRGKGREEKTEYIKIVPQVERAIRAYLKARGKADKKEPLFISTSNNSRGERMTTRSISGTVKAAFKAAGYDSDRLTAHSTRHTAVTLALLGGGTLQEVQQFARHSNISTTMIYAHNLDRAANKSESTIAAAIF